MTNTGTRPGRTVVQVYAAKPDSAFERPHRWLVGFEAVYADPGQRVTAAVTVPSRTLAHWTSTGWSHEHGSFELRIGQSVLDLPLTSHVDVKKRPQAGPIDPHER